MGLFHRRGKQLKTRQDFKEWWERQTTDDTPRTTTTRTDKDAEPLLHDPGQDGQDEDGTHRADVGQSDETRAVADVHDEDNGNVAAASDGATTTKDDTSEVVGGADEADAHRVDDATTENVEPTDAAAGDKTAAEATTVDVDVRSQTAHGDSDEGTEPDDVERESVDIPATPVTDAVAGRSDEIPRLEVSTISADEADAASITSTFGAQANNAAQKTEQSADNEVMES